MQAGFLTHFGLKLKNHRSEQVPFLIFIFLRTAKNDTKEVAAYQVKELCYETSGLPFQCPPLEQNTNPEMALERFQSWLLQ